MPIVDHNGIEETPWRPNYRKWDITRAGDGTTSSDLSYSEVGEGAGAPLHATRPTSLSSSWMGCWRCDLVTRSGRWGATTQW